MFINCLNHILISNRTITINSNIIVYLKQTLKDVEKINRVFAGFDTCYEEFKEVFREVWKDEMYKYLRVDRSEKESEGKYRDYYEGENTCIDCFPEINPY